MRNVYNRIMLLMVALMASVTLSSCFDPHDDPFGPDVSPVVGYWTASYGADPRSTYDLTEFEIDQWAFFSDGTGYTSYYNSFHQWVSYRFFWDEIAQGVIQLRYEDGTREVRYYSFDRYNYLMLSTTPSFSYYYGYRLGR